MFAPGSDGNYYLFNTRRGVAHVMTARAYESYWAAANRASSLEDPTETLRDLIEKGFLPPPFREICRAIGTPQTTAAILRDQSFLSISTRAFSLRR